MEGVNKVHSEKAEQNAPALRSLYINFLLRLRWGRFFQDALLSGRRRRRPWHQASADRELRVEVAALAMIRLYLGSLVPGASVDAENSLV